jgi:DNA topoisomerase-1
MRVGNDEYARLNRSFGLSTLRSRHAKVTGASIRFRFRGKGGRDEEHELVDRRLATIVRRCRELPGQALFQYPDTEDPGTMHKVSSEDVNDYLRDAAGSDDFSAKDFRTWAATLIAFLARESAKAAIEVTADELGDTPTVTRNSYIHPAVLEAIDEAEPARTRAKPRKRETPREPTRRDELELLAFLRRNPASATRSKPGGRRADARTGRRAA